jgi:hypothetical protein
MSNKNNHKKQLAGKLIALVLVPLICVGGVHALSVHETSLRNTLQSHTTQITIAENFAEDSTISPGETVIKEVRFKNEGSSPAFLRVAYIETFERVSGYGEWLVNDSQNTNVTKNWTDEWTEDWIHIEGWYYYKKVLPASGITDLIMESVSFASVLDPNFAGANYEIDFIAEAVQLSDEEGVNTNATKTVFGKSATVMDAVTDNGAVISGTVKWS